MIHSMVWVSFGAGAPALREEVRRYFYKMAVFQEEGTAKDYGHFLVSLYPVMRQCKTHSSSIFSILKVESEL